MATVTKAIHTLQVSQNKGKLVHLGPAKWNRLKVDTKVRTKANSSTWALQSGTGLKQTPSESASWSENEENMHYCTHNKKGMRL